MSNAIKKQVKIKVDELELKISALTVKQTKEFKEPFQRLIKSTTEDGVTGLLEVLDDEVLEFIAKVVGQDKSYIEQLNLDDLYLIVIEIMELNGNRFLSKVAPRVKTLVERLGKMMS